ncbi:hypothetical protein P153DRAFT_367728 [Dothidotthia symphoricarpi CBS 119687]|uniref:Filamentation protein-like protein n=1 Tax=Dothidotthia symphoricarpi CBS 119687 TaxID=1392245 RepID=A0A6A6ABN7_9PLEO|nr:uncharacterized protein P153DRAFT_367728 [Dothidotthia symphoricarpi CBS 119687]KAF2128623.1 hypothetical protein P153DRAFT_367728 [Dothidotthia symphoricarpi CBS 119687]
MVHAPESEKALRYIQQLDEARCTGRWKDVPELCRKVEKHAPHRRCLTLTARSEAQIAEYSTQRPSTGASTASSGLSQVIPSLLTAVEEEGDHNQDAFQATVCLGWLHYVLDEPGLAVARLPGDFRAVATTMSGEGAALSGWSRVCLAKGAFLKGSAQEKSGAVGDAVATYSSIVPWLSSLPSTNAESPQFKMWTEHLLVRLCQLSDQSSGRDEHVESSEALQTYRYWARLWESSSKSGGHDSGDTALSRRLAWKAYYDTLSTILRHDLTYSPESAPATQEKSPLQSLSTTRLRQRAELKRVETIYESLLIRETQFPRASESNREIEAWTDSVMYNWRLLCGPTWSDGDLGEGGKEGVGRSVLDILYRAATKTFHSTQILRHLFVVHASLAEFDLAFKAFDSYVEIITRGKDRAEEAGQDDVEIDNDSTILRTSAEAIRILCRFGSRKEAQKALDVGHQLEKWLEQCEHVQSSSDTAFVASTATLAEPAAIAAAYCSLGISQAHWARFTYEVDQRAAIQAKAVQYLRKSLAPSLGDANNIDALYALALVLAETREIPGAIKVAKRALSAATKHNTSISADGVLSGGLITEFGRERKLIPIWHVLALLLTSRSDFTAAEKACEAAFEQFGDPTVLFGSDDADAYRSEHLNAANGNDTSSHGVVDYMEGSEKREILQIKMTQLALVEVTDSAIAAVDGCDELLALYARLFGDPARDETKIVPSITTLAPPKSAVGTGRGSIFRGRGSVRASPQESVVRNPSVLSSRTPAMATQQASAPAIQVTEGDASKSGHHRHHLFHHHKPDEGNANIGRSSSKARNPGGSGRPSVPDNDQAPEVPPLPEGVSNGTPARGNNVHSNSPRRLSLSSSPRKSIESNDRPLRAIPHNLSHTSPPQIQASHSHKQDVRLPAPFPSTNYVPPGPRFSKIEERRQKVSLLVGIWIFISGLYSRAQMFNDANEAVAEALKLIEKFEAELAVEHSTARALAEKGWGGGKSVEELWADAFAARGESLVAQSRQHQARSDFERALLHFPDHPEGIVGLSNILLDIYAEVIPMEPDQGTNAANYSSLPSVPLAQQTPSNLKSSRLTSYIPSVQNQLSPPKLNRLAARDRAFGLLSTLTKLGTGWDYSEAWFALARAYEESGMIDKTKEVLWWCVELEDTHPVRGWKNVTLGGFVL